MRPIEILMVEDSPGDIRLTQQALKEGKVKNNLFVVNDGGSALEYLQHSGKYKNVTTPDLILLDLNLPGKNGRSVLREVKAHPKLRKIPVVILTSSENEEDVTRTYELHANCYIKKPVNLEQFMAVVKSVEDFWLTVVRLPKTRT